MRYIHRQVDPDKLTFRQYKLRPKDILILLVVTLVILQIAKPMGSAIYFLITQTRYGFSYPKGHSGFSIYLGYDWDHLDKVVFHQTWSWWTNARHNVRGVLIGVLAMMLSGALTIKFKPRKTPSRLYMLVSPFLALVTAVAFAAGLIWLYNRIDPSIQNWGSGTNSPFVASWIGSGEISTVLVGLLAGFPAKLIMHPTFAYLQQMSIERHIEQGDGERWWWLPNYRNRFRYFSDPATGPYLCSTQQGFEHLLGVLGTVPVRATCIRRVAQLLRPSISCPLRRLSASFAGRSS